MAAHQAAPHRRRRFALPDDDEGGSDGGAEGLTHMGRPLADVRDAFGAQMPRFPITCSCADRALTSRHVWTISHLSPSEMREQRTYSPAATGCSTPDNPCHCVRTVHQPSTSRPGLFLVREAPAVCTERCARLHEGRPGDMDDEDDERLNADMTAELHFGGGFIRKDTPTAAPAGNDDDKQGVSGRRRTKKEARSLSLFASARGCKFYGPRPWTGMS